MARVRITGLRRVRQARLSVTGIFFCIALLPAIVSGEDAATQTVVQEAAGNAAETAVDKTVERAARSALRPRKC